MVSTEITKIIIKCKKAYIDEGTAEAKQYAVLDFMPDEDPDKMTSLYNEERITEGLLAFAAVISKLGKELIAFVARAEGRLVAAAYLLIVEKPSNPFLPNGFEGEVLSVYTEEEYRGNGICSQLIKNLIGYGKEKELCRINLMATEEGYPIYKKLGFEDKVQNYKDMRLKL